ncbi:hypothetical protein [Streptosporangium sp. KLBMP 9127]|nr:hypothetical protein [Streptosporangium sp. KLBMP 9127]
MKITLELPGETSSAFVVVAGRLPAALGPGFVDSVVPWRMRRPFRRIAADTLGSPRLTVSIRRARRSPWLAAVAESGEQGWGRARHHVVVSSVAPVSVQPEAAQTARAAARALAAECDGVIHDVTTGAAVFHCGGCPGERTEFALADDWLGGRIAPALVASRGLRRFGLPEILLDRAACGHDLCTGSLLRAVAERLLAEHLAFLAAHPAAVRRTIDDRLRIDGGDVALSWAGAPGQTLQATPCPAADALSCAKVAATRRRDTRLRRPPYSERLTG